MTWETIRVAIWVVGIPIIIYLLVSIVQRVRAIRKLDTQLKQEEAQMAQNPYAAMARMMETEELLSDAGVKKKTKRRPDPEEDR